MHLPGISTPAPLPTPLPGLPPLLGVRELSSYLGVLVSTVYDWRARGLGPRAYRFGKHLKVAVDDLTAWIEAQRDPAPLSPRQPSDRQ